jgi:twitching motility protein PilJ
MPEAAPDGTVGMLVTEQVQAHLDTDEIKPLVATIKPDEAPAVETPAEETDLIELPVLGRKTVSQHQRTLMILLGATLAGLGALTFYTLNQADKVAQQLNATGQGLMQSQRLAKSVSQALVGGAQAFPDVKESSDVLAKTVRGL